MRPDNARCDRNDAGGRTRAGAGAERALARETYDWLARAEREVFLTVTDSCRPPWRTFRGAPAVLLDAIEDAALTEFFVTPRSGRWVAFDMHHNCIMLAGVRS